LITATLVLSGAGTPPIASKAYTWPLILSASPCVRVVCALIELDASSTATEIVALGSSPVNLSIVRHAVAGRWERFSSKDPSSEYRPGWKVGVTSRAALLRGGNAVKVL